MNKLSVLQNVKTVFTHPYPHICIDEALPQSVYDELDSTFPEELICSTTPHDGGICYRYKAKECAQEAPPAIWQDFFAYHTSPEYFQECARLFEPHIVEAYGDEFMHNMLTKSVSVRDVDNSGHYVADCQFVVHEPVDQTGTSRTPHVDNPVEIYAGLLYMRPRIDNSSGGNFSIHKTTGPITEVNKSLGRQIDDSLHSPVKQVPYQRNTFCMFLNVKDSVHSVTPRLQPEHRRRSINIIGEFNGTGKMWKVKEIKS